MIIFIEGAQLATAVFRGALRGPPLLIHEIKTKKITTVKEIWIPGLN